MHDRDDEHGISIEGVKDRVWKRPCAARAHVLFTSTSPGLQVLCIVSSTSMLNAAPKPGRRDCYEGVERRRARVLGICLGSEVEFRHLFGLRSSVFGLRSSVFGLRSSVGSRSSGLREFSNPVLTCFQPHPVVFVLVEFSRKARKDCVRTGQSLTLNEVI
jgi:hypothetical protein